MRRATVAVLLILIPNLAWAQRKEAQSSSRRTWTLEVYGGGVFGQPSSSGSGIAEFPVGTTFLMETDPRFQSRAISSWYFGDGARLVNEVASQFSSRSGLQFAHIVPLDDMLTSAAARQPAGGTFGVRLGRQMSSRFGVEFDVGWSRRPVEFSSSARNAIEESAQSFRETFEGLFGTAPLTNLNISSDPQFTDASRTQIAVTGALTIALRNTGRINPYVVAGGGVLRSSGGLPHATLRGRYQFRLFDTFPMGETDFITIRLTDRDMSAMGVFGGGIFFNTTARQGLRVDVRAQLGGNKTGIEVEAGALSGPAAPGAVMPSITNPGIQFSTLTGIRTSLSGGATELQTFSGSGMSFRIAVTAGYVFRF